MKKIANSEIKNINNTQTSYGVLGVHRPIYMYVPYKQIKENNSTIWSCSTGLPIFLQVHWKWEKKRGEIHVVVKGPFTTFPFLLSSQKKIVPDKWMSIETSRSFPTSGKKTTSNLVHDITIWESIICQRFTSKWILCYSSN